MAGPIETSCFNNEGYVAVINTNKIKFSCRTLLVDQFYLFAKELSGNHQVRILWITKPARNMKNIQTKNTLKYVYTMTHGKFLSICVIGTYVLPPSFRIFRLYQ